MAIFSPAQFDAMIDRHFGCEIEDDVESVLSTMVNDLTHDLVREPAEVSRGKEAAHFPNPVDL